MKRYKCLRDELFKSWKKVLVWATYIHKYLKKVRFIRVKKVLCISESCIEIKINLNFHFHTSLWCLKKFYEPFETPQRSVKIKIYVNFFFLSAIGIKGYLCRRLRLTSSAPRYFCSFWKSRLYTNWIYI